MRIFALTSFILLLTLSPAGNAGTADTLAAASSQHIAIYHIVRDFHMQTLLSGDPERATMIKATVAASDKLEPALTAATGNAAADAALKSAHAEWLVFRKLAQSNKVTPDGTDENLVIDLNASAARLDKALAEAIAALKPGTRSAAVHAADLLLQRTAAAYLQRAASISQTVGAEDDFDIATATTQLDGQLQALTRGVEADADAEKLLAGVLSKWSFIKPRLLNYNEKTVPYIVDRYAQQMSDQLGQLASTVAGK